MLINLNTAAERIGWEAEIYFKDEEGKKIRDWDRVGNRIWEKMREREARLKARIPLSSDDPWADFPAKKLGRRWMVDAEALEAWMTRHWRKAA